MQFVLGDRFYKNKAEDDSEDIRIIKIKNENLFRVKTNKGIIKSMKKEEIYDNYSRLIPDGLLFFSILNVGETKNEKLKDVMISLFKTSDLEKGDNIPYVVCRQSILDLFTTQINNNPYLHYAGLSINRDNVPEGVDFKMVLMCDGIDSKISLSVYLDDTLDDILSLINTEKIDKVLTHMESKIKNNIVGYYKTLKELLEKNDFMLDVRMAFNIEKVDFKVSIINDYEIIPQERVILQEIKKCEMIKTYVIPYTREIDLDEIKRNYLMICDSENKIYIVAYDKGSYIDDTYKKAFNDTKDVMQMLTNTGKEIPINKYNNIL